VYLQPRPGLQVGNNYPSQTIQGEQAMTDQHVEDNGQHIEKLDRRLRELGATFTSLGDTGDIDEMLQIIHKPGFTTQRDVYFVNTLLDVVQQTALDAAHQRAGLRDGVLRIAEDTLS
jgi:hypothetical protein